MRTFEVLRRSDNRWLLAGVFDDAGHAIADAKSLLERALMPEAVRVMAVEQRETSFVEWVIFQQTVGGETIDDPPPAPAVEGRSWDDAPAPRMAGPASLPGLRPQSRPARAKTPRSRPRATVGGYTVGNLAALALVLLALGGFVAIMAWYGSASQHEWIFNSPEAQKPHALRNPWTGEISR
jgi:hypothetical protein